MSRKRGPVTAETVIAPSGRIQINPDNLSMYYLQAMEKFLSKALDDDTDLETAKLASELYLKWADGYMRHIHNLDLSADEEKEDGDILGKLIGAKDKAAKGLDFKRYSRRGI